jgi:hypothetical protein
VTDIQVVRRYGFERIGCPCCGQWMIVRNIADRCLNCGWREQAIGE